MSEVSNLAVPVTTLNNGVEMPMLGFGVFQIAEATDDMAAIAPFESGASLFFDHRDPERVQWLKTLTVSQ